MARSYQTERSIDAQNLPAARTMLLFVAEPTYGQRCYLDEWRPVKVRQGIYRASVILGQTIIHNGKDENNRDINIFLS